MRPPPSMKVCFRLGFFSGLLGFHVTGGEDGGHDGVRILDEGDVVDVQLVHLDGVVDVQAGDINRNLFRNILQQTANFQLADFLHELTATEHAGGSTHDSDRKTDGDRLAVNDFQKIHVKKVRKLKVRGLLQDVPEEIPVDISGLNIDNSIKVNELHIDNITFVENPNSIVAAVLSTRNVEAEQPAEEA